jgi:hypothetical protein
LNKTIKKYFSAKIDDKYGDICLMEFDDKKINDFETGKK